MTKKRALVAVPLVVLAGVIATVFVLGVRGGGMADMDDKSLGSSAGVAEPAADEGGVTSLRDSADSTRRTAGGAPLTRAVISTGQVTMRAKAISTARAEVLRLVTSWNGLVTDERTSSDSRGRMTDTTMTLRVPSAKFNEAMAALAALGEVKQESRKSEDVTTQVIDNDARVRAAERSIRQIERLLSRAEKLGDIIAIESDLARRQADLDSLKSQQAWLEDQTSLSTINVYLSRSGGADPREDEARGFLTGLEGGWNALQGATVLVLTAVGAVLPFAVLMLLLGVPVWLVVRRRSPRVSAGSAPAQSA
jgi:Domain of unknown function (DUF4349)